MQSAGDERAERVPQVELECPSTIQPSPVLSKRVEVCPGTPPHKSTTLITVLVAPPLSNAWGLSCITARAVQVTAVRRYGVSYIGWFGASVRKGQCMEISRAHRSQSLSVNLPP